MAEDNQAKPFKAEYAIDMLESAYSSIEEDLDDYSIAPSSDVIEIFSQALAIYSHMEPGSAASLLKGICDTLEEKAREYYQIKADGEAALEASQEEDGPDYDEAEWEIPEDFWELKANLNPFANLTVLNRLIAYTFVHDGYGVERDEDGDPVLDDAAMQRMAFFITLFGHNILEDTDSTNWTHRIEDAFGYYQDVLVSDAFIDQSFQSKTSFKAKKGQEDAVVNLLFTKLNASEGKAALSRVMRDAEVLDHPFNLAEEPDVEDLHEIISNLSEEIQELEDENMNLAQQLELANKKAVKLQEELDALKAEIKKASADKK